MYVRSRPRPRRRFTAPGGRREAMPAFMLRVPLFPSGNLEFALFFTTFTHVLGPNLLHGIVFLLPAILMRFSTNNLQPSYPGSSSCTWFIFFRVAHFFEKFPKNIRKKSFFLIHLVVARDRSPDLKRFEIDPFSHSASTFKLSSDFEGVAEFFFRTPFVYVLGPRNSFLASKIWYV